MAVAGGTVRAPRRRISRRWLYAGAAVLGFVALVALALAIIYPRVGAYMVRSRVGDKLAKKLGRDVTFGNIRVRFGHAVLRDVDIRGPRDGDTPLVHVDRIDVDFDGWASLVGSIHVGEVAVDGVVVTIRRDADGRDNVRDVIERLRGSGGPSDVNDVGIGGIRPTRATVAHVRLFANDDLAGATALVGDGDATWTPDELALHGRAVTATTTAAPKAKLATLDVVKKPGQPPLVTIGGGELELWPRMALSGIEGTITPATDHAGRYGLELAGGYGGVPGRLWTATGDFDARAFAASLDVEAARFQLDRLRPILERTAIVDYAQTSVDTKLHLDADRGGAKFAGSFHLRGVNVGHPKIADREVRDLDLSGDVAGSFDRAKRVLTLERGNFVARDIPFSLTGSIVARSHPAEIPAAGSAGSPFVSTCAATSKLQTVDLRFVVPPIDCQRALVGIPKEIAPHFAGYRLRGVFDTDIHLAIDFDDLDATKLDGHVGINHCRVVDEPGDSPKRLKDEFEHFVEVEQGRWESFEIGPSNPEFVPLDQISPHVINSIMSTEDSAFYQHRGFIPREFQTATITNLKGCDYKYGASSITMQLVKNVLLTNEKTLGRKLQELFLTWHVENTLTKDRILEIYLNAIEYGPGLYGIGPAARGYFGKAAKDLNPVEAAFFSSILPDPKGRYRQYCAGAPTKWTTGKIERILAIMLKRNRLSQEDYDQAIATPLVFVKDGNESEEDCMKRVTQAIRNRRPTDPTKRKTPPSAGTKQSHKKQP
jgi:hypothetical protein